MARRLHNRRHIERYVIFYDNIFAASMGFINVEEMTGKPESRPPVPDSDRVWDFIEDQANRDTARYLSIVFRELRKEYPPFYTILGLVGGWIRPMQDEEIDHGALRRWKAGETQQDRDRAQLFERAISWIEERLNDKHPNLRIQVNVPRREDPIGSPREHADRCRTWRKEDSFRLIGPEVQKVIDEEGCGVQAAKALIAQRTNKFLGTPCSFWRIEEAWLFWKREQEEKESA